MIVIRVLFVLVFGHVIKVMTRSVNMMTFIAREGQQDEVNETSSADEFIRIRKDFLEV